MTHYLAIDIGGTSIKYGIVDQNVSILEKNEMDTEAYKGGPEILKKVLALIASYKDKVNLGGVAISSAGMVDPVKGEIFYSGPQIPNYAGTNFKKTIEDTFHIPCEIENDVNCAGLAEAVSGSAKETDVALCLTIGTGIGGCLLLNSKVFHGFSNSACEVGYMHLSDGAFQDLASTTALISYVADKSGDKLSDWNGYRIFREAKEGNTICIEAIDRMVGYLCQGIANIAYVVNPQQVVLGGGIMGQVNYLEERINKRLNNYLVSSLREPLKISYAHYKNDAGMIGAFYNFKQAQQIP